MTDFCRGQPKLRQPARWASYRGNIWIISTWKQRDIDILPSTARYEQTFPVSLRGQTQLHRICINTGSFSPCARLVAEQSLPNMFIDICIPVLPSSQAAPEPSHVEVASFFAQRMKGWHLTHGVKPAFSGFHQTDWHHTGRHHTGRYTHKFTHHHPAITLILPLPLLLFYAQSMWSC